MAVHLMKELEKLKDMTFRFREMVQEDLDEAIHSLLKRDGRLAQHVIDSDEEIDQMEVDIEEECLKALALFQPVAIDLRYIVAVLKLNSDLERIGDLAVNIANAALFLSTQTDSIENPFNVNHMADKVKEMVNRSLESLVELNSVLATEVLEMDKAVDSIHKKNYTLIENRMREDIKHLEAYVHFLSVSKNLERIADHATNIAEDVIYLAKGDIIRHQSPI